jgi:hypothetical protein
MGAEGSGMGEFSKDNLLRSWKEISAYLGCDVRTCHRWEAKHGMPVHRAEGSETKSPVFAYRDELDQWFRETFKNGHSKEKAAKGRPWVKWAVAGGIVLALAAVFFIHWQKPVRRQPADFAIDGSFLVILDKNKHELWRKDTGLEDLKPEGFYRALFQVVNKNEGNMLPVLIIRDINGDGDNEVVFAPKRERDQTGEGWVFCYDRDGKELWSFPAGKEIRCGGKTFSPDYRVAGFLCRDLDGDGRLETIIESFHAPDWPCQLAVLDASGKMIGEFWNSGYLREIAFHDIDGDGREELIVCGVNNEYKGGCLAIFDSRRISGGSPQTGEHACEGFPPGSMLYYVTTPQTDVSAAFGHWVAGFRNVEITSNDWIRATTGEGLIFEFDFGLRCLQVSPTNGYRSEHQNLVGAGKLTSVLGDAYFEKFREGVRYWSGTAMVPVPTRCRR